MKSEAHGSFAGNRVSDGFAKPLAAVAAIVAIIGTVAILGGTGFFGGALGGASIVWAPFTAGTLGWLAVYHRMTRLVRCPSGCGKHLDVLARQCPRCGRPLQQRAAAHS